MIKLHSGTALLGLARVGGSGTRRNSMKSWPMKSSRDWGRGKTRLQPLCRRHGPALSPLKLLDLWQGDNCGVRWFPHNG